MADAPMQSATTKSARISYWFMALLLALTVWLHLAAPVLACLFSYLALTKLVYVTRGSKWGAVILFVVLLAGMVYGLTHFGAVSVREMPEIAEKSIPKVIAWAEQRGIHLPFTDYQSLKELLMDAVKGQAHNWSNFAKVVRAVATDALLLLAGCVVATSLFLHPQFEIGRTPVKRYDIYGLTCAEIGRRFEALYRSFITVMGAQIIISAINTVLTGIFAFAVGLPYAVVVIGVTFICGMLPVIGNILSNTVVVMIGFTVSPEMALGALLFLVVIHKLEYFLNSKIVGWRIRNPLWLTLLGLIVGERLMGIPGMVLAPVLLNYIKLEASSIRGAEVPPVEAGVEVKPS